MKMTLSIVALLLAVYALGFWGGSIYERHRGKPDPGDLTVQAFSLWIIDQDEADLRECVSWLREEANRRGLDIGLTQAMEVRR